MLNHVWYCILSLAHSSFHFLSKQGQHHPCWPLSCPGNIVSSLSINYGWCWHSVQYGNVSTLCYQVMIIIEGMSAKPCYVTIWVKKNCCKKACILACGLPFIWETLLWSYFFTGFLIVAKKVHRLEKKMFLAYTISRKRSKLQCKNYWILLNIPEQNCTWNLEHFQQNSILIKIPNALFCRALQLNVAGPLLW